MAKVDGFSNLGLYQAGRTEGMYERHETSMPDGLAADPRAIDGTPNGVALIGAGALLALVFLKRAGFRFSFGVSAGR